MHRYWLLVIMLSFLIHPAFAYTAHISAPAVLSDMDRGVLTQIYANVTAGIGIVSVNSLGGNVANNTVQSADVAVSYAMSYLGLNESRYNVTFTIDSESTNISGPSAGLAFTLLSISALKHMPLNHNFTMTGTINSSGIVGLVGGVYDKIQAAKSYGSRFILVPYVGNYSFQYMVYYLSQQAYGIPVIEVHNVSQAIPYAFSNAKPFYLEYNITQNYHPDQIPNASSVCSSCNFSIFGGMVNMTFGLVSNEISLINQSRFGSVRNQLESQLLQYKILASKGYLYTGADLAFEEYPTAYLFADYHDSNFSSAYSTLQNISAYCNLSAIAPQLTNLNYEYVIGGSARKAWAHITLSESYSYLNASGSSDSVLASLYEAAPAFAWCAATNYLYNASYSVGGDPVELSPAIGAEAERGYLNAERRFGPGGLYVQAANYSISHDGYGAALYSLGYAGIFYSGKSFQSYNSTTVQQTAGLVSNSLSLGGIWPAQFGLQASFYMHEASINTNRSIALEYLNNAYTTALLSKNLSDLNSNLKGNFIPTTNSTHQSALLVQISNGITLITYVLIMILLVIFAMLIAMILHIMEHKSKSRR